MTRCPEAGCRFYTFADPVRALAAHKRQAHDEGKRVPCGPSIVISPHRSLAQRLRDGEVWSHER